MLTDRPVETVNALFTKNELLKAPTSDMKRSSFGMAAARATVQIGMLMLFFCIMGTVILTRHYDQCGSQYVLCHFLRFAGIEVAGE